VGTEDRYAMEGIFKEAAVLSALIEVYTIPCRDRGHINVMLVLQSCTNPLRIQPSPSSKTSSTSSDGTCDVNNEEVEEDVIVVEEGFVAVNEKLDIVVKQEEIPGDITFPDIKVEPNEVS